MSALDAIYNQTITVFNRVPGRNGEPTLWIPTVISGVHLIVGKSCSWDSHGGKSTDDVRLHIRYKKQGKDVMIPCKTVGEEPKTVLKKWYEQKEWRRNLEPEDGIAFSIGNNDDFDFFIEGEFREYPSSTPISDNNFGRRGFYGSVKAEYGNVFAFSSVHKYDVIPHFEITAR